ncbi:unnamed protein product [Lupinus luteus]|uniref:Uncharacterized protein n=1 Tax=Lupinus luteus TaxID=3873 RepID=A0AAV1Y5P2_LUPLU
MMTVIVTQQVAERTQAGYKRVLTKQPKGKRNKKKKNTDIIKRVKTQTPIQISQQFKKSNKRGKHETAEPDPIRNTNQEFQVSPHIIENSVPVVHNKHPNIYIRQ